MYDVLVCVKDFKKPAAANSCRWGRREELHWRQGSPWESRWGLLWNRAEDNFDIKRMSYIRWWQSQRQQHQRPNLIAKVSKERGKCKGCNGSDPTLDVKFRIWNNFKLLCRPFVDMSSLCYFWSEGDNILFLAVHSLFSSPTSPTVW